ncbi:MAG: DHH family phosphoesterase [Desulfuromonadales bacterium]|nr:DHH family phosphoesterase [Desulfuromonadales bacterium]
MSLIETEKMAQALAAVQKARTIVIASHVDPDGDTLGASLAWALLLKKAGKDVTVYNQDPLPYSFQFLPGAEMLVDHLPPGCDLLCLLDFSEFERAGKTLSAWHGYTRSLCIDHHLTAAPAADINLIYPQACATGELIYELALVLEPDFGLEVAINLYTAILTDTGSFRYSNSTPSSFQIAGELVRRGVEPWNVTQHVYESQPAGRIKLVGRVLDTLKISSSGKGAAVWVTQAMFDETGTNSEYTDGLVNYPRSIAGVEVAFTAREVGFEEYKLSFRSRGTVNVAALAAEFGGGGHHNAAGCRLQGPLPQLIERVFAIVDNSLSESAS